MSVSLVKRPMPQGTIWVCHDCTHLAVNGESPVDRPADLPEPWARESATSVTPGLTTSAHGDYCDQSDQCGCETRDIVDWPCDACGDPYAGARHAFTWWE